MFLKENFDKVNFEKKSTDDNKSMKNYITQHVKSYICFCRTTTGGGGHSLYREEVLSMFLRTQYSIL